MSLACASYVPNMCLILHTNRDTGLEVAAINPSFIIGPPRMARRQGESLSYMRAFLEGGYPARGIRHVLGTYKAHVRDI